MLNGKRNYLVRATACGGRVRAFSIDATGVVGEVHRLQRTEPAVTAALGRLATGALLLGATLKEDDHSVTVRIQGDGPAGTLLASANGKGEVRGLVTNPTTDIDQVHNGKLNVSGVVGRNGRLTVARELGLRHPYVGVVELVSGEVGDDLAHYLASSEQTRSAVGIGVFVQSSGMVEAAGGYMVQLMPAVSEAEAAEIEAIMAGLPHPTSMLRSGDSPEDILERIFPGDVEFLSRTAVRFHCPCSRERVERSLALLGPEELRAILDNDAERGVTEVVCEFCAARYELSAVEVEALAANAERIG